MHTHLIVGANNQKLLDSVDKIANFKNRYELSVTKIANVRELKKLAQILPEYVFILTGIDKSSLEAQNALLKTLEEPPSKVQFILIANNISALAPTLVSRCSITKIGEVDTDQRQKDAEKYLKLSISKRFNFIKSMKREEALKFLEQLGKLFRTKIQKKDKQLHNAKLLKEVLNTHKMITANVNTNLALSALTMKFEELENSS